MHERTIQVQNARRISEAYSRTARGILEAGQEGRGRDGQDIARQPQPQRQGGRQDALETKQILQGTYTGSRVWQA